MRTKLICTAFVLVQVAAIGVLGAAQNPAQSSTTSRPMDLTPPTSLQRGQTISARDVVRVEVFGPGHDIFSGSFPVGIDGYFEYPRLGRIKAAGLTAAELAADLTSRLDGGYLVNPQVTVGVEQAANKKVSLGGEVRSQGTILYAGRITALEAIIRASGVTAEAGETALILRDAGNIQVDLPSLLSGDKSKDVVLEDGDFIMVPKSLPVFVQGPVNAPGPYIVRRGTTVQQVVNLAGGVTEKGKTDGIKIQRPDPDPKKKPQEIKVKDYKTEIVKPGDTVIVPTRVW